MIPSKYLKHLYWGAHLCDREGVSGTLFRVWAPNACAVSVAMDLGDWKSKTMLRNEDGTWEVWVPGIGRGTCYRYVIEGADHITRFKADPVAFYTECRPGNASLVWPLEGYQWNDLDYVNQRGGVETVYREPVAIYEVHLGSWKKDYGNFSPDGFLNYRQLADQLADYVQYMGFTHVELIGICEYPLDESWGYQVTGYFSPTHRYGTPEDFRYFVDRMHQSGIGVILDWVPAHFPKDSYGLERFDGTCLYESADPLLAEYPEWGTCAFDHGKCEVREFLISSALYWIEDFHVDALRVDAVAAMLHTNFSRSEWRPNRFGGTENLESIAFLKELNEVVTTCTSAYLIAEDSSIMEGITKPVDEGGLGFAFKWNMGWMNDSLDYIEKDPIYRRYHHDQLTHCFDYAMLEHFMLVLSHDEMVHLKKPMLLKMPGGRGDQLACLKAFYTYQFTHPGKKLLFMGQELAEDREWDENRSVNWEFADNPWHRDVMECVRTLLHVYRQYPVLHTDDNDKKRLKWVNRYDRDRNILAYIRRDPDEAEDMLLVVINFSPVMINGYACGVPFESYVNRIFSTCDSLPGQKETSLQTPPIIPEKEWCDYMDYRITYDLRPYEAVIFKLNRP